MINIINKVRVIIVRICTYIYKTHIQVFNNLKELYN